MTTTDSQTNLSPKQFPLDTDISSLTQKYETQPMRTPRYNPQGRDDSKISGILKGLMYNDVGARKSIPEKPLDEPDNKIIPQPDEIEDSSANVAQSVTTDDHEMVSVPQSEYDRLIEQDKTIQTIRRLARKEPPKVAMYKGEPLTYENQFERLPKDEIIEDRIEFTEKWYGTRLSPQDGKTPDLAVIEIKVVDPSLNKKLQSWARIPKNRANNMNFEKLMREHFSNSVHAPSSLLVKTIQNFFGLSPDMTKSVGALLKNYVYRNDTPSKLQL